MRAMIGLLLLACATGPAVAGVQTHNPSSSPNASSDVVVVGKRNATDEIREFVGVLDQAHGQRQLSKFEKRAVCPGAMGLLPAQRAVVIDRLRRVAEAAGVPVAKRDCAPNVVVIVARDRDALMAALARESARYFPGLGRSEVRRLVADRGPAVAWQVAGPPLNADGREMAADRDSGTYLNETTFVGSRITGGGRPQVATAIVAIRADALTGLTVTQLADYAAMRLFARTDPDRAKDVTVPTILGVLEAPAHSEVPLTLTRWDLDLLRALYNGAENLTAAQQRSAVARSIERSATGK